MSTLEYNDIVMECVKTHSLLRVNELSDDRADLLRQKVRLDVQCVYNPALTSYDPDGGSATSGFMPAQTDAAIRFALMQPGKALNFKNGGYPVEVTAGYDRYVGPQPIECSVTQIAGQKTWLVRWVVEYWCSACPLPDAPDDGTPPLISNRWTQTVRIGVDKTEQIFTHGVAVFDLATIRALRESEKNPFLSADFWRAQILPLAPSKYFQRTAVEVAISSLGDVLTYTIVDQEMMIALGDRKDQDVRLGVESFSGSQSYMTTDAADGGVPSGKMLSIVEASVQGARTARCSNLIVWLLKLCIERLAIPNGPIRPDRDGMLKRLVIRQHLDRVAVDLHAEVLFPPSQIGVQGIGGLNLELLQADLTTQLNRNGKNPQMLGGNAFGTGSVPLVTQAIKDSACQPPGLPEGLALGSRKPEKYATLNTPTVKVTTDLSLPEFPTKYSDATVKGGVITDYKVSSRFDQNPGRLAASVAGPPGASPPIRPQVIQVNLPMTTLVVDWTGERIGAKVPIPATEHSNLLFAYMGGHVTPEAPVLAPDGVNFINRVSGVYRYLVMDPTIGTGPGQILPTSTLPWETLAYTDEEAIIRADEDVTHGIIDPPAYQSGSGWIPPIPGAGGPVGADG